MHKYMTFACAAAFTLTTTVSAQSDTNEAEAVSAVQRHVDAYRSGSLDRFVATFAPDATVTVSGVTASGRAEIRAFYASNFADNPHTIRVVDSGMGNGFVYVTAAYTFSDKIERCCSYSEYEVRGGKIASLNVTF
ncbi:MAG: nuclear transport factor 2 family protein [Pseudomonadota bacterium]